MSQPWKTEDWWVSPLKYDPAVMGADRPGPPILHDVTLRDGKENAGLVFSFDKKIALAKTLDAAGLLRFGDADALVEGIHMIAERRGFGEHMAEGSARLAREIGQGTEQLVMAARGQELPMHEPRLKNAFGLAYALSPTGADHMHNMDDTAAANAKNKIMIRLNELGIKGPLPLFGLPDEKVRGFVYETAFKHSRTLRWSAISTRTRSSTWPTR